MTFTADFPGAIVVEAARYGYPLHRRGNCKPRAWCLHTPEEPPDDYPATPYYFHNLQGRDASTHYFVSHLGFVFQCVPEDAGAYANAVEAKPYPAWADPAVNLNLQTLSVEVEGYARSIHETMPRGSPQWVSLVRLIAHRCKALGIPPERTFGHYAVSIYRSDPGRLDIGAVVEDVRYLTEEENMPTTKENITALVREGERIAAEIHAGTRAPFVRAEGSDEVYKIIGGRKVWLPDPETATREGMAPDQSNVTVVNAVQLLCWPG